MTQGTEVFDVQAFARERRLRTRNLHDGRPVPPVRQPRMRRRDEAYTHNADGDIAIIGRYGYIIGEGEHVGWVLLCRSARRFRRLLTALRALPDVSVTQEGDTEAAGIVTPDNFDAVLDLLSPYCRRSPAIGRSPAEPAAIRPR